jgi:D-arabinose 1-dehydrogenase-like Zn-dependent alcohol dehydrogenase
MTGSTGRVRTEHKERWGSAPARHGITPRVELMPMSQANGAIQRLRENKARYRIVLVNHPDDAGTATEKPV